MFIGCTESIQRKIWKEGQGAMIFRSWKTADHGSRTIFLSLSRASCKPPLVTRRGKKTDACDLPPWRLNKLRATNFNRNSDYAEVTKTCVRAWLFLCIAARRSVNSRLSLKKLLLHAQFSLSFNYSHYFSNNYYLFFNKCYYLLSIVISWQGSYSSSLASYMVS